MADWLARYMDMSAADQRRRMVKPNPLEGLPLYISYQDMTVSTSRHYGAICDSIRSDGKQWNQFLSQLSPNVRNELLLLPRETLIETFNEILTSIKRST